jgi:hypothetical protein
MKSIRVVRDGEQITEDMDFSAQCHAVLDRLIAKGSTTVVFLADNGKKLFEIESVPDSLAVRKGAIALAEDWSEGGE